MKSKFKIQRYGNGDFYIYSISLWEFGQSILYDFEASHGITISADSGHDCIIHPIENLSWDEIDNNNAYYKMEFLNDDNNDSAFMNSFITYTVGDGNVNNEYHKVYIRLYKWENINTKLIYKKELKYIIKNNLDSVDEKLEEFEEDVSDGIKNIKEILRGEK